MILHDAKPHGIFMIIDSDYVGVKEGICHVFQHMYGVLEIPGLIHMEI